MCVSFDNSNVTKNLMFMSFCWDLIILFLTAIIFSCYKITKVLELTVKNLTQKRKLVSYSFRFSTKPLSQTYPKNIGEDLIAGQMFSWLKIAALMKNIVKYHAYTKQSNKTEKNERFRISMSSVTCDVICKYIT